MAGAGLIRKLSSKGYDGWDIASALLFAGIIVLILINLSSFQSNIDMPYHLAVSKGYVDSGGVTTWDWWDYAPGGRTQMYPPLLHILLSIPLQLGVSVETVGVTTGAMMFPLMMLSLWWMTRRLFSSRQAFYTLLCLLIPYALFRQTSITSAASLVMILTPLIFLAVEKKRWVTPAILLTACLYTHLVMGHFVALALFIYMLHRRDNWKLVTRVLAAAYLLYLPWGIHIAANFSSFSVSGGATGGGTSIHLFIWMLALAAVPLCYLKKGRYYILPSYLLSMVPIVFFYPNRFWEGHVFLPLAMLGGLLLTTLHDGLKNLFGSIPEFTYKKKMLAGVCIGVVVVPLLVLDPVVSFGSGRNAPGGALPGAVAQGARTVYGPAYASGVQLPYGAYIAQGNVPPLAQGAQPGAVAGPANAANSGLRVSAETTTPVRLIQGEGAGAGLGRDQMFSDANLKLFAAIEEVAGEGDLVYLADQSGHMNDLIFAETGCGVFSGMFNEVRPDQTADPMTEARIIVVSSSGGTGMGGPRAAIDISQLEPVTQAGGYTVYLNPTATGHTNVSDPVLPMWGAYLLLTLGVLLMILDQYLYLRRARSGGSGPDGTGGPDGSGEALESLSAGYIDGASCMIAIPCLNEGGNVGGVVSEIKRYEPGASVLVIDDGSRDATADEARTAGAMVVANKRNRGIGRCLEEAFELALASGYGILVRMDGDGQHDPYFLTDLMEPLRAGAADVTIGSRYLDGGMEKADHSTTPLRRKSRKAFSLLIRFYTGRRFSDPNSGYCAYSRPAMRYLLEQGLFDFPESEILIGLQRGGLRVSEVPVAMRPRRGGESSVKPIKALGYLLALCFDPIFGGKEKAAKVEV